MTYFVTGMQAAFVNGRLRLPAPFYINAVCCPRGHEGVSGVSIETAPHPYSVILPGTAHSKVFLSKRQDAPRKEKKGSRHRKLIHGAKSPLDDVRRRASVTDRTLAGVWVKPDVVDNSRESGGLRDAAGGRPPEADAATRWWMSVNNVTVYKCL